MGTAGVGCADAWLALLATRVCSASVGACSDQKAQKDIKSISSETQLFQKARL